MSRFASIKIIAFKKSVMQGVIPYEMPHKFKALLLKPKWFFWDLLNSQQLKSASKEIALSWRQSAAFKLNFHGNSDQINQNKVIEVL